MSITLQYNSENTAIDNNKDINDISSDSGDNENKNLFIIFDNSYCYISILIIR